jgi:hypothetical protein
MKELVSVRRVILQFSYDFRGHVSLRRQPSGRGDYQEPHVLFSTVDERVASSDDLAGTTRHYLGVSGYPQRAQSGRRLFKDDRPRRVDAVALRSAHAHALEVLTEDGLLLDWSSEVVWLNPPWALLPDVLSKLRAERPAAVLIVPVWPSQTWWSFLFGLDVFRVDLPTPKFSVSPLHKGTTEHFLNTGVRVQAVFCRPDSKR